MAFISALQTKWADLKLRTKLITGLLVIVAASILLVSVIISVFTNMFFNDYVRQIAGLKAEQWKFTFASYYLQNNSWDNVQSLFSRGNFGQARGFSRGMAVSDRIILVNEKGITVADSYGLSVGQAAPDLGAQTVVPVTINGNEIGQVVLGVTVPGGMATLEDHFFQSVILAAVIAGMVAILLSVALAFVFARRITVPLVSLTEAANKLAGKDFKHRLSIGGADEIGTLAGAFNTMADAIDTNIQIRNRLIADVAHELRTPVAILRANLESLQAGVISPTVENIASLHDEVLRLSRLINDLQEISLAESGQQALHFKEAGFNNLVKRVVNNFQGQASVKDIRLEVSTPKSEMYSEIDEDRIIQVLSNIISNALQHTPQKGRVNVKLQEPRNGFVVFEITDNGPGIDPKDKPFIFERFYRAAESRTRAIGGTGLGLAITKSIVEAHGGLIEVESPVQGGSTFKVFLPINK